MLIRFLETLILVIKHLFGGSEYAKPDQQKHEERQKRYEEAKEDPASAFRDKFSGGVSKSNSSSLNNKTPSSTN